MASEATGRKGTSFGLAGCRDTSGQWPIPVGATSPRHKGGLQPKSHHPQLLFGSFGFSVPRPSWSFLMGEDKIAVIGAKRTSWGRDQAPSDSTGAFTVPIFLGFVPSGLPAASCCICCQASRASGAQINVGKLLPSCS